MAFKKLFVSLGLGIAICGGAAAAYGQDKENRLVAVSTGGAFHEALQKWFFDPFTDRTAVKIDHVAAFTSDQFVKVRAMSKVGNVEWDVVTAQPESFHRERDYLERLDCSRIPNAARFGVDGTCGEYGMLRTIGGGVIAYNTAEFPNGGPQSWADFWDVDRYPGPRCLPGITPHWMVMVALLADGVPKDKLFPLDIERAIGKLEAIKPHVAVWWESGNESQNLLRQGECAMSWMWSGRALELINEGQPIAVSWNQHLPIVAYWAILKDAPNKDAAYEFLNFFMERPEAHLKFSNAIVYDTANRLATAKLDADARKLRATSEENLAEQVPTDFGWIAEHRDEMRRAFDDMLTR